MRLLSRSFKIGGGNVVGCPVRSLHAALVLLGWSFSLPMLTEATEWFETFEDDSLLDARNGRDDRQSWQFHQENGAGSYSVRDGVLVATFGPCPHKGRSLYFGPRAILEGDVTVEVDARLPDEGKLMVFAHGDNRSSGYRGILHPQGQLDLFRVDYTGEVLLASTPFRVTARSRSVRLQLQTHGDHVAFVAWEYVWSDRTTIEIVDETYRSGNAGAGIRQPGYGECGEFFSITIAEMDEPAPSTTTDPGAFLRGDCNQDGAVNVADATCTLNQLFTGGGKPPCTAALNTNEDVRFDIADAVTLLNFLFAGGPALAAPFPRCGAGALEADKALGCEDPSCR